MTRENIHAGSTDLAAENFWSALQGNSLSRALLVAMLLAWVGIASAVEAAGPPTLTISGPTFLGVGLKGQYIAYANGQALAADDPNVYWIISQTDIASIGTGTGIATGLAEGPATVRFDYLWDGKWWSSWRAIPSYPITVTPSGQPVPPTLTISGPASVRVGLTGQYIANVNGVALASGDPNVVWVIPETDIASIGSTTGIATGIAEGSTTVSFDYLWNGALWSSWSTIPSYPIRVTPSVPPTPPTLTISGPASVDVRLTGQYIAYVDGVALESDDPNVWWYISETSIASIGSRTGIAKGIAEGSATVRFDYLWDGKWWSSWSTTPSYPITVKPSAVPTLTISGPAFVGAEKTAQYIAYTNGVALASGDPKVLWVISDENIASIGSTNGIATGLDRGSATVRFDYLWDGKWWSSWNTLPSYPIIVTPIGEPVPPTLTISGPASVGVGLTAQYTAYADGVALESGDPNVWWVLSQTTIASIGTKTGIATGLAEGAAEVRFDYLWDGKWWSSWRPLTAYPITVTPSGLPQLPRLTISGPRSVGIESTAQYIAYADGVPLASGDTNVWWVISETSIASIGSTTGIATGLAEGSATVHFDYLWDGKWLSSWGQLPAYLITVEYTLNISVVGKVGTLSWLQLGFILQEKSDLGNPLGWTDVPGGNVSPVTISVPSTGARFYRLKKSP